MTNKEAIYRQDVLDLAKKGVLVSNGNYTSVCKAINELPPVTPQPKTGYWISHHHGCEYECSECHDKQRAKSKYCPNCGARMVEPQERSEE